MFNLSNLSIFWISLSFLLWLFYLSVFYAIWVTVAEEIILEIFKDEPGLFSYYVLLAPLVGGYSLTWVVDIVADYLFFELS